MFDTPAEILHAAEAVRDAGYKFWDVITPVSDPRHGPGDGRAPLACAAHSRWPAASSAFHRHGADLVVGRVELQAHRRRQAALQPAVRLSDLLRADHPVHGVCHDHRHVPAQPPADALPRGDEAGAFPARDRRPVFRRDRGARSALRPRRHQGAAGADRRPGDCRAGRVSHALRLLCDRLPRGADDLDRRLPRHGAPRSRR